MQYPPEYHCYHVISDMCDVTVDNWIIQHIITNNSQSISNYATQIMDYVICNLLPLNDEI